MIIHDVSLSCLDVVLQLVERNAHFSRMQDVEFERRQFIVTQYIIEESRNMIQIVALCNMFVVFRALLAGFYSETDVKNRAPRYEQPLFEIHMISFRRLQSRLCVSWLTRSRCAGSHELCTCQQVSISLPTVPHLDLKTEINIPRSVPAAA